MSDETLTDGAMHAYVWRRMVFTLLAQLYEVPDLAQRRVAYGDRDVENANRTDEPTRRAMIDRVCDELVAEGLAEVNEDGGYSATVLLEETGIDFIEDEDARKTLLDAKCRVMAENGTLAETLAESGRLSPDEVARALVKWGTPSTSVNFDVHRPRHDPAA